MNISLKNKIQILIDEYGGTARFIKPKMFIKKHGQQIYNEIIKKTQFLDEKIEDNFQSKITFNERIYCILNDIVELPRCLKCNNHVRYSPNSTPRFKHHCSCSCRSQNPDTKDKIRQTNLKKYGVTNVLTSKRIMKQTEQKYLAKYGVKNYAQSEEYKQRYKEEELFGKHKKLFNADVEKLKELYLDQKISGLALAEQYNCTTSTLYLFFKRHNIPIRSRREANQISWPKRWTHKDYILPSGRIIHLQGYESDFLDYVFSNKLLTEDEIQYHSKTVPYLNNSQESQYFPDFYIPKYNLLVECKSSWILKLQTPEVQALKEQACANLGFNYCLIINNNFEGLKDKFNQLKYTYSEEECKKEFKSLINCPGSYTSTTSNNKIVLTYQPHFYEIENELWKSPKIKERLISNRKKFLNKTELTDKELLRGFKISGIHVGFSHFNPQWIKKFIEDYKPESIYDPCGGWGHRLLGTVNKCNYIYNDWDPRTYQGVKNISKTFNIKNTTCYNNDCTSFTPPDYYDTVFTCPPYFNIETYDNKKFKNLDDYKVWWQNLVNCSITSNVKYFAFVITNEYEQLLISAIPKDFILKERIDLKKKVNHFNQKNSSTKKEILVIFARV